MQFFSSRFFYILKIFGLFILTMYVPRIGHRIGFSLGIDVTPDTLDYPFPVLSAPEKPPFSMIVFILTAIIVLMMLVFLLFPRLFGFKKATSPAKPPAILSYPLWFFPGVFLFFFSALVLVMGWKTPVIFAKYGYVPFMVGYTMMMDGFAFKYNGGNSPINKHLFILLVSGIASGVSWYIFAVYNYYVGIAWYYPFGDQVSQFAFKVYFFVGASTLVPSMIATWAFLGPRKFLSGRYLKGPKVVISRKLQIGMLFLLIIAMFFSSWVKVWSFPLFLLGPSLSMLLIFDIFGVWTPIKAIAKNGNWTYLVVPAIGQFIIGILFEWVNGVSVKADLLPGESSTTPGFWAYSVPFIDVLRFGQMPVLGMSAYLLYGIYHFTIYAGLQSLLTAADTELNPVDPLDHPDSNE